MSKIDGAQHIKETFLDVLRAVLGILDAKPFNCRLQIERPAFRNLQSAISNPLISAYDIGTSPKVPHCAVIVLPLLLLTIHQTPVEGRHTPKSAFPSPS